MKHNLAKEKNSLNFKGSSRFWCFFLDERQRWLLSRRETFDLLPSNAQNVFNAKKLYNVSFETMKQKKLRAQEFINSYHFRFRLKMHLLDLFSASFSLLKLFSESLFVFSFSVCFEDGLGILLRHARVTSSTINFCSDIFGLLLNFSR